MMNHRCTLKGVNDSEEEAKQALLDYVKTAAPATTTVQRDSRREKKQRHHMRGFITSMA